MQTFDVAIIGTGPGGGMAACQLAATGLKVLLLEQHTLPRHKACGGAMPKSVRSLLNWDFSHVVESEITTTRNLFNYEHPSYFHGGPILFVDRTRFDYHLVERALSIGSGNVTLRESFRVENVEESDAAVTITGENGEQIRASYLIAADGAFSKTARCLELRQKPKYAPAIDAEVEVDPDVFEAERHRATFNFFCLPQGYGWIFPKKNVLACGVGTWGGERFNLSAKLNDFLTRSFPQGSIRSVRTYGYPIPIYNRHQTIATQRVCLVGDAANLVDPLVGEGIRYALISGSAAAQLIERLMAGGSALADAGLNVDEGCQAYQRQIHATIGSEFLKLAKFALPLYLKAPDYFYHQIVQNVAIYSS